MVYRIHSTSLNRPNEWAGEVRSGRNTNEATTWPGGHNPAEPTPAPTGAEQDEAKESIEVLTVPPKAKVSLSEAHPARIQVSYKSV